MLQNTIETFAQLGQGLVENPVAFGIPLAIGLLLIVLKWRFIGWSQHKAAKDMYSGWTTRASETQGRHETGIGTKDVYVMKPIGFVKAALFSLLFFGGGALFYGLVELQEPDETIKDWMVFASMCGFSMMSVALLTMSLTRIQFDAETISRRSLLQRRFEAPLSGIETVKPLSKTLAGGIKIVFRDQRTLKVPARFSGYEDLLRHLSRNDPKLALLVKLTGSAVKKAL